MSNGKRWSFQELEILKKTFPEGGAEAVFAALDGRRTIFAIRTKASMLGIFPAGCGRVVRRNWTREEDAVLFDVYTSKGVDATFEALGGHRAKKSIIARASALGLRGGLRNSRQVALQELIEAARNEKNKNAPSNAAIEKLTDQVRRLADAAETSNRQFAHILEAAKLVNEHEAAIENIENELVKLNNKIGRSVA